MDEVVINGDSQAVQGTSYGSQVFECYPYLLQAALRAAGRSVRVRSFATGGHDTGNVLGRMSDSFAYARPKVAINPTGTNDPGVVATAQSQANIQAWTKAMKHRAIGDGFAACAPVAAPANLPSTGLPGQMLVVFTDTHANGGMAAATTVQHPTITTDLTGTPEQTVWQCRYPGTPGDVGWGRVARQNTAPLRDLTTGVPLGAESALIMSIPYLNFTAGGDTPAVPYAANALVRGAQQAAVAAENSAAFPVVYVDLYGLQRDMIVTGKLPDFSAVAYDQNKSFHYATLNQHYSPLGHAIAMQALFPPTLAALRR